LRAAGGELVHRQGARVEVIEAELDVLESHIELARARGELTRRLCEYEINRGGALQELLRSLTVDTPDD
jgi:hypothetical protein